MPVRLHDTTLRKAFEDYCRTRVDVDGARLAFDTEAPTADAQWVKQHFGRVEASLPNGYLRTATTTGLSAPELLPHMRRFPDNR